MNGSSRKINEEREKICLIARIRIVVPNLPAILLSGVRDRSMKLNQFYRFQSPESENAGYSFEKLVL